MTITAFTPEQKVLFREVPGFWAGLRPLDPITVSEWADRYRRISSVSGAFEGGYKTERTPYVREIADNLGFNSRIQKIVIKKGAQLGLSEMLYNLIGYSMDVAPCVLMIVMPTEAACKNKSKSSIGPMIMESPILREKLMGGGKSRARGNAMLTKEYPGGMLLMVGANSPVGLSSMPARVMLMDEVDRFPPEAGEEGSIPKLADARTRTFISKGRKIVLNSTPTTEEESVISPEFEETDQRHYHVPCPSCGLYQDLVWENFVWEPGKPETVHYPCAGCGFQIEEKHKTDMMAHGRWVPHKPENADKYTAGYFIWSAYSPTDFGYTWEFIVREYLDAKDDLGKMKAFENTVLGRTTSSSGESLGWEDLYERSKTSYDRQYVPKEVHVITMGVDVQKDRLEMEVVGWGKGKRSWSIEYFVIYGNTGNTGADSVWAKLGQQVERMWEREDGLLLPVSLTAVDTGYNSHEAYEFCRHYDSSRVIPIKGDEEMKMPVRLGSQVDVRLDGKKVGAVKLWGAGVSYLKSELYSWLALKPEDKDGKVFYPKGYCFFPKYDPSYFKMLTGEQLQVTEDKRGRIKYAWRKKKGQERNEALDCRNYARAAFSALGGDRWQDEHYDQVTATVGVSQNPANVEKPIERRKPQNSIWKK